MLSCFCLPFTRKKYNVFFFEDPESAKGITTVPSLNIQDIRDVSGKKVTVYTSKPIEKEGNRREIEITCEKFGCYFIELEEGIVIDLDKHRGEIVLVFGNENGYTPEVKEQLVSIQAGPVSIPQKHDGPVPGREKDVYSLNVNMAISITLELMYRSPSLSVFEEPPLVTFRSVNKESGTGISYRFVGSYVRISYLLWDKPVFRRDDFSKAEQKKCVRSSVCQGKLLPESHIPYDAKRKIIRVFFDPETSSRPDRKDLPEGPHIYVFDTESEVKDEEIALEFTDPNKFVYFLVINYKF